MAAVTATSEAGRTWSLAYASHLCTVHELAPTGGERHCNLAIFRDAGKTSIAGMQDTYKNARLTHLSIHASRPNQVEIYLSIVHPSRCSRTQSSTALPARGADREPHLRLAA